MESRSRSRKLGLQLPVLELPGQVPRLLHHLRSGRTVGAAGQMDATAAHLDEEQHVEPGQPDRVDDEEVDREQLVGVLMDELAPGAQPTPWCRLEAIPAKHSKTVRWEQRRPSLRSSP